MTTPWMLAEPMSEVEFSRLRRRAVFDCDKWDPQVEDSCALARSPIMLRMDAWRQLHALAEALAREVLLAEQELRARPALHRGLGLPLVTRQALARTANQSGPCGVARLARFDFHLTNDGWRISEANTDVPGGLNEAAGITRLVAPYYSGTVPVGDPAGDYARALLENAPDGARIALVHATAYTDDHQVMRYVARRLESAGAKPVLVSPAHLRWREGRAVAETTWYRGPLDRIVRFFPAEWLGVLPRSCGSEKFFGGSVTPVSNPATAILTQTKRFPLVWDQLKTSMPAWRALLPETRDPRDADWEAGVDWVIKPALGRVGEGVGIPSTTPAKEWKQLAKEVRRQPDAWVAQRRFMPVEMEAEGRATYPCIGVYTLDGRTIGAYGRVALKPLVDWQAKDTAVLVVSQESEAPGEARSVTNEECFAHWAPDSVVWSQWTKPVVFTHLDEVSESDLQNEEALTDAFPLLPEPRSDRVLIVNLPGATSVLVGLALAGRGHRPVPLFNGNVHPGMLIDVAPIARRLRGGVDFLQSLDLPPGAPPAFLLDADRMSPSQMPRPGLFDNRWMVLPQDFPSAVFLIARGVREALLVQRGHLYPEEDLAHVLLRWQQGGIHVLSLDLGSLGEPKVIKVTPPSLFRRAWHRAIALMGLRRSNVGGFGAIIPEQSSRFG